MQLETWSSPEVKQYLQKDNNLAIFPVGSFEQHGPHAPLGTDTFIAYEISRRIAQKLGAVVLPPVWYSVSGEHMDFAGTITVSPDTLISLVSEVVISLQASGFTNILILNGHGTNERYLNAARKRVIEKTGKKVNLMVISYWDKLPEKEKQKLCSLEWGLHANEFETSIITAILPSIVKKLKDIANFPDLSGIDGEINEQIFKKLIKGSNGVWGDPGRASIKKGRSLLALLELTLVNFLNQTVKFSFLDSRHIEHN